MDVQLKRGILDACVLSVLQRGDSHGYQIIKDLTPCMAISESTLYPILKRLETGGCVRVYSVEHSGRLRKVYRITDAGRGRIGEFMADWQELQRAYRFIEEGSGQ